MEKESRNERKIKNTEMREETKEEKSNQEDFTRRSTKYAVHYITVNYARL